MSEKRQKRRCWSLDIAEWLTLKLRAISRVGSPASFRFRASALWYGVNLKCGPNFTPRAFARALPSLVRARISSRSNSAKPPSTVSIKRP
jgi:hypothetical protein